MPDWEGVFSFRPGGVGIGGSGHEKRSLKKVIVDEMKGVER